MDLKVDANGKPYYVTCGEVATARSKFDPNWCFCPAHANTAVEIKKWDLEPMEEKDNVNQNGSRC